LSEMLLFPMLMYVPFSPKLRILFRPLWKDHEHH